METALPDIQGIKFTFTRRPEPVPGEFRPRWKVAVVLLALHYCGRGQSGKTSISKLKVLSWATRDSESQKALVRYLDNAPQPDDILLRHEPALVRALNLSAGLGFILRSGESITLTDAGKALVKAIISDVTLMGDEKNFLLVVEKRLTEEKTKLLTEPQ
jgi:hypothetical protein